MEIVRRIAHTPTKALSWGYRCRAADNSDAYLLSKNPRCCIGTVFQSRPAYRNNQPLHHGLATTALDVTQTTRI